jgi:putative intracellular protease/amidase
VTIHIAGGHGAHHDIVGNPLVEKAATQIHEQGKIVTAVCHATPALGKLLAGGPATGYSPELDAVNVKLGFVLPEFNPPYNAHDGLRKLGAKVSLTESVASFVNVNHTETFNSGTAPIVTGTGPEATDNVARQALSWILEQQK